MATSCRTPTVVFGNWVLQHPPQDVLDVLRHALTIASYGGRHVFCGHAMYSSAVVRNSSRELAASFGDWREALQSGTGRS